MSYTRSVSILMPVLNEEAYVRRAIMSLLPRDECLDYELIVLDGGSSDRTRKVVEELSASNPRIRLVQNEARIQSAGINKGVALAKPSSTVLVRADCHAEYPPLFAERLLEEMAAKKVASVVVPMRTTGVGFLQRAIAAAQNSRLGNGGAVHRSTVASRYVEHGHHAAFDRTAFLSVGGYDETFTHNEDAELDVRLRLSGQKIWLCSDLAISYFPRKSFSSLARQYFNHGAGRSRTVLKHRCVPKIRQMLPIGVLGVNVAGITLGLLAGWPFLLPVAVYLIACTLWSAALAVSRLDSACLFSGFAAAVMHHSWATGYIYGSLRWFMHPSEQHVGKLRRFLTSVAGSR
jgi:succinoglycan biosynthesis protein ExoA